MKVVYFLILSVILSVVQTSHAGSEVAEPEMQMAQTYLQPIPPIRPIPGWKYTAKWCLVTIPGELLRPQQIFPISVKCDISDQNAIAGETPCSCRVWVHDAIGTPYVETFSGVSTQ